MFFKLHSFLFSNGFSKFISHQRALEKSIRGETGAAVREVTIPGGLAPVVRDWYCSIDEPNNRASGDPSDWYPLNIGAK